MTCFHHILQCEEHTNQLIEEKDHLSSTIRQQAAHSSSMKTEHVSIFTNTTISSTVTMML